MRLCGFLRITSSNMHVLYSLRLTACGQLSVQGIFATCLGSHCHNPRDPRQASLTNEPLPITPIANILDVSTLNLLACYLGRTARLASCKSHWPSSSSGCTPRGYCTLKPHDYVVANDEWTSCCRDDCVQDSCLPVDISDLKKGRRNFPASGSCIYLTMLRSGSMLRLCSRSLPYASGFA